MFRETQNKFKNENEEKLNFGSCLEKYSELARSPEKIHEFASFEFSEKENGDSHIITIINENPEERIEDYKESIKKVFSRADEIHPQIAKEIKFIRFSDVGKELFDKSNPECDENEQKAKQGLINGVNGNRFSSDGANYRGIEIRYRGFEKIRPRYESDNPDIEAKSKINHFEMIMSHELFHELNVLSQYENSKYRKDDGIDETRKFGWMNQISDDNRSFEFTGILDSGYYKAFVDDSGNVKDRWKIFLKYEP